MRLAGTESHSQKGLGMKQAGTKPHSQEGLGMRLAGRQASFPGKATSKTI